MEYKTYTITLKSNIFSNRKIDGEKLNIKLNEMGQEGWKLVTKLDSHTSGWTNNIVLIFMREIN